MSSVVSVAIIFGFFLVLFCICTAKIKSHEIKEVLGIQETITKIPITLTKSDKLKGYRGILGKADEKLLKEFELEANDIY